MERVRYITFIYSTQGATFYDKPDFAVQDFKIGGENQDRVTECEWYIPRPLEWNADNWE